MDSRFQILDEILAHVRVIAARTEELLAPEEVATKLRLTGDQVRRKMKNGTFPKGVVWFERPGLGPYFSWQGDDFRHQQSHWFPMVYFQFFQGTRPSEAVALRRRDVDLHRGIVQIRRSRVASSEAMTKTKKSKQTLRLHPGTIKVLRDAWPVHAKPDDYVFTTPTGAPVDQANFYKRVWLRTLRRLGLRERPFYNTRHAYVSYLLSIGKRLAFVSEQTGHSIRTLERHYAKYLPQEDDLALPGEGESESGTPTSGTAKTGRK